MIIEVLDSQVRQIKDAVKGILQRLEKLRDNLHRHHQPVMATRNAMYPEESPDRTTILHPKYERY